MTQGRQQVGKKAPDLHGAEAQSGGAASKAITRSHHAAAASSRDSPHAGAVRRTESGKPDPSTVVGRAMAGRPAKVNGAQNDGSPVAESPRGAGPPIVGARRASERLGGG